MRERNVGRAVQPCALKIVQSFAAIFSSFPLFCPHTTITDLALLQISRKDRAKPHFVQDPLLNFVFFWTVTQMGKSASVIIFPLARPLSFDKRGLFFSPPFREKASRKSLLCNLPLFCTSGKFGCVWQTRGGGVRISPQFIFPLSEQAKGVSQFPPGGGGSTK